MPILPSLIGHIVNGYYVEQLLAQGQASVAYRARHIASRTEVTFTTALLPETLSQTAFAIFMARFTSLAARISALSHEYLLPVLDYGEYQGYPYLVTESTVGASVATHLKQQGRYSPESALPVLRQVASALDYAHQQGVIHGNLRPAALLLQSDRRLQLTGLEMVHLLEAKGIVEPEGPYPHLRNLMGTYLSDPAYLAPEYVQGRPADARSDLYALGLLLFELLSGKSPFSGRTYLDVALQHIQGPVPSFSSRCPELQLSPVFDLLLSHALAYAPQQRFERAAELIEAYEQILGQQSQTTRQTFTVPLNRLDIPSGSSLVQIPPQGVQKSGSESLSNPYLPAAVKTAPTAVLTLPSPGDQDRALLRQIEEHVWDGYDLPDTRQIEPGLSISLGRLFSPESQRLRLTRRSVLLLTLVFVVLIIGSIGIGAWGTRQFQSQPAPLTQPMPGQPTLPQVPKQPRQVQPTQQPQQQAQPINDTQGNQQLAFAALPLGFVPLSCAVYQEVMSILLLQIQHLPDGKFVQTHATSRSGREARQEHMQCLQGE